MKRSALVIAGFVSAALVSIFACTPGGTMCAPGDYLSCACPTPVRGFAQCADDGTQYGACDCSGTIPGQLILGDAGSEARADDGAAEASALLPFMSPCTEDKDCTTGLCFHFNAKGPHCSMPCKSANTCPPPSDGCSAMGVCKAP